MKYGLISDLARGRYEVHPFGLKHLPKGLANKPSG